MIPEQARKELEEFCETLEELPTVSAPPACGHVYFDGASAWRKLGADRDGNSTRVCRLCGAVEETG